MVSMSGGTVDVIALDRQRRLYAFTVGNVRYATSCNARLLGQYEQATWGHHLFTDTNLFIRKDGAQLPVNIVQRHGNKKYALALIIVPQSRFGDPYLNDGTLIPRTTCSINWTAVRELFHHGGGWLNVTNDSNGAHCNILPACCRDRSYSDNVSECKNMYTWIPKLNATILSKKGGSNVSNITDISTGKGGSMDLDACAKPSGNGGSNYSCSNRTTYAPHCFVDLSDDPFGNRVEKIKLTCNITVLLDGDNNSCREVISTITDTDATGYHHKPGRARGICLATFPKVANTTSWCSPDPLIHQEWDSTIGFQGEGPTCRWCGRILECHEPGRIMMCCPAMTEVRPVIFHGTENKSVVDRIFMISSVMSGFATILSDGCTVVDSSGTEHSTMAAFRSAHKIFDKYTFKHCEGTIAGDDVHTTARCHCVATICQQLRRLHQEPRYDACTITRILDRHIATRDPSLPCTHDVDGPMGMSGWADLSAGRQPDRLALTLSAASKGYQEVLRTMIDTGTSDSDIARLIVARKYLLEAIDHEIALRPDKLSWRTQQQLSFAQLLLQDVCHVRTRGTNSAALVQMMCRGVLRHLELMLRAARKKPNDDMTKDVVHCIDMERRKECSELHISLCEYIFGGACSTLPHAFMQKAHDTLYGVRAEMPVDATGATDHGYGTLAHKAAADTDGIIAAARKKYFGAAIGPAWKNNHQDTWRQMIHCMVSAKLIPGPILRTSEEIARDSRHLAAASAGTADTISSVRSTPNGDGACSPINMMTSAAVNGPVSHAAVVTEAKQTYLGRNKDMLLKLQRTDTVLASDNTLKEDRLRRNNEQMDSNTTTMLLVKQNLWLRLQQQLLLGQQPKSSPDSVQPNLVRATFEAATRAELQPNTYHDQGSQWIESRRAAASNADPPGDVDHPWRSCSCEEHSWHCDTKGMPLFFVCNLLVYADTPLTGQQWEQQRCIDFHGLMMVSILDILCYADAHGEQRVYKKADFFDDMKALRAYTLIEEPARLTVDDTDAQATFERKRRITNAKAKTAAYKTALAKHQAAQQNSVRKRLRQELFTREFESRRRNAATARASAPRTVSHDRSDYLHTAAGSTAPLHCVDSLLLEVTASSSSKLDPGGSDQRINSGGRSLPYSGPAKSPRT